MRREMERLGHRFMSNCDSELLAVYTADNLEQGATLEDSLKCSIKEIDGVFTYLVATADRARHGQGHDGREADGALRERRISSRWLPRKWPSAAIIPHEIDTSDPYDEEVRVWQR